MDPSSQESMYTFFDDQFSPAADSELAPAQPEPFSPNFSLTMEPPLCFPPQFPACESAELLLADSTESVEPQHKGKKRGRKPMNVTAEQKIEAQARRVERNRYFAREHRKRRKQHIVELEVKVAELTQELKECRERISVLESAPHEDHGFSNIETIIRRAQEDMHLLAEERLQKLSNIIHADSFSFANLVPAMRDSIRDKERVLSIVSEMVVELTAPVEYHRMICPAEGANLQKAWEKVIAGVPETREAMQSLSQRVKESVGQYLSSVEGLKRRMGEFSEYMMENWAPRVKTNTLESVVSMLQEWLQDRGGKVAAVTVLKVTTPEIGQKDKDISVTLTGKA